jgi:hypothetical protein
MCRVLRRFSSVSLIAIADGCFPYLHVKHYLSAWLVQTFEQFPDFSHGDWWAADDDTVAHNRCCNGYASE